MNTPTTIAAVASVFVLGRAWTAFWLWVERRGRQAGGGGAKLAEDLHAQALARWNDRSRARIIEVGTISQDEQGNPLPQGFRLNANCNGRMVPEIMIGPDGEIAWGGYTRDELVEIVRRRKEFER